jgi:hypothetical protein
MTGPDAGLDPAGGPHTLVRHPEPLAVVRLGAGADVPDWAASSSILSVTATAQETSVVCAAAGVPRKARQQGPFTAFAVEGTLDFSLTGVLRTLLAPLADAGVPVFVLSTFDTDWVLVPQGDAQRAADVWSSEGHLLRPADPSGSHPEPSGGRS